MWKTLQMSTLIGLTEKAESGSGSSGESPTLLWVSVKLLPASEITHYPKWKGNISIGLGSIKLY